MHTPDTFSLAARKRADGARSGDVAAGDLNASWQKNPLTLKHGETRDLGDFSAQPLGRGGYRPHAALKDHVRHHDGRADREADHRQERVGDHQQDGRDCQHDQHSERHG